MGYEQELTAFHDRVAIERKGYRWSDADTHWLLELKKGGYSYDHISKKLGRSVGGAKAKLANTYAADIEPRQSNADIERTLFTHWCACRENGLPVKFAKPPKWLYSLAMQASADRAGVPLQPLLDGSRLAPIAHARQTVMAYLRACGYGYSPISKRMGLDHTTILHGVRSYERREAEAA